MLRRILLVFALILGSHSGLAAEPASADNPDAAATSSADATASTASDSPAADADTSADNADTDEDEAAAGSLDGEGFVPSVQISEDLSVSFPTDI